MSASDGLYLLLSRNRRVKNKMPGISLTQGDRASESKMAVREKYVVYMVEI